jgi:DNA-directed RNA polymerase subunit L
MNKIGDIKIKSIPITTPHQTKLQINVKGDSIDYCVVNTIRRVCMTDIPTYTFETINIAQNNSVYNNNYLELRLKNMPLFIVNKQIYYVKEELDDIIVEKDEEIIEDDLDVEETHFDQSSLNELTMYVKFKNNGTNTVNVTTSNCKFYMKGVEVPNPYKIPLLIVKLQYNQEIELSAISKIGIEKQSACHSAISTFSYDEISDNEYNMFVSSVGQHTEQNLINISCLNIIKQLKEFNSLIPENDELSGLLILHDIDHTLGNLISTGMRLHKHVTAAAYSMPHLLNNLVQIRYSLNKSNIKVVIDNVVNYYVDLFTKISTHFS